MSGNPSDGHLHLQKYNWLERIDLDKALDMLARFAETIVVWKRLAAEAPASEGSPPHGIDIGGFMSV